MILRRLHLLAGTTALTLIAAPAIAGSTLESWGVILQGNSIRVGINSYGTFGNGNEFGSGINFDRTGSGTFNFSYDFLAPGSPYDAFSLGSGTTMLVDNNNDEWETGQNVSGTLTDYSGIAHDGATYDNRVVWTSTMSDVAIKHDYFFNNADLKVQIRTTITALSNLSNLYFARAVDPDAVVEPGDTSSTINNFGTENGFTYAYGEATVSGYLMGLLTDGVNVEAVKARSNNSWGFDATGFPTQAPGTGASYFGMDPEQLFNLPDSDPDFNADGATSDDLIALAFKLGNLAAGESITFLYSYIFGNDFGTFVGPGIDAPGTETSVSGTASVTRAVATRVLSALTRLSQQETAVMLPSRLSGITVSTKGAEMPNRVALRFGALVGGTNSMGEVSVGSVTGAYQIDDRLVAGASYERSSQSQSDQGFSTESDATSLSVYLRSRDVNGEGLTWKLAYGASNGEIDTSRAAGIVGAEAGHGVADLRARLASVELGYGIRPNDQLLVSPFLRLAHSTVTRGAYTEDATIAFPLSFDEKDYYRTTATLGVDVAFEAGENNMISLGAGLDSDLKASDDTVTGTSTIPGLATFATTTTGTLDRNRFFVSANFRHNFADGSSVLLTGRMGEDAYSSSAYKTVGVNYEIRF